MRKDEQLGTCGSIGGDVYCHNPSRDQASAPEYGTPLWPLPLPLSPAVLVPLPDGMASSDRAMAKMAKRRATPRVHAEITERNTDGIALTSRRETDAIAGRESMKSG